MNGTEAYNGGKPDENFTFCIAKDGGDCESVTEMFKKDEVPLETWSFDWYEDLFAQEADTPSVVNVASKAYRAVSLLYIYYSKSLYINLTLLCTSGVPQGAW